MTRSKLAAKDARVCDRTVSKQSLSFHNAARAASAEEPYDARAAK